MIFEYKIANISLKKCRENKKIQKSLVKLSNSSIIGSFNKFVFPKILKKTGKCKAKVFVAYIKDIENPIGWVLCSKECTDFSFHSKNPKIEGEYLDGWVVSVYVNPYYRCNGIAFNLLKRVKRSIGKEKIYLSPWDKASTLLYHKFVSYGKVKINYEYI